MNSDPIFATTTPVDYPIAAAFGYMTNGRNFPGLLGLTFQPSSTIAGYSILNQTGLLALSFPNLLLYPANAAAQFNGNTVMTSIAFDVLTNSLVNLSIQTNASLTSISLPVLATSAGVTFASNAVLPAISLPSLTTLTAGFSAGSNPLLASISAPLLSSATSFSVSSNPSLSTISFPALVTASGAIFFSSSTILTTFSLPSLVTAASINVPNSPVLVTVSLPNYLPTSGGAQNFGGCALNQASVDHVLARCVANAAYVSGTVTLNGGTNSPPSATGLADKATLIARGVTVLTN